MAEARKKAAQRKAAPSRGQGESPEVGVTPATGTAEPAWDAHEDTLVFPSDPAPTPSGARIQLPSSGTAEEILGRVASRDLAAHPVTPSESAPISPAAPETPVTGAHAISFFTSASAREEKVVEASEHLATFYMDKEEYGVDVRLVQEIIRITEITQVPRAPEFIRGVINLRGRIIPVVDLKRKLGLGRFEASRQARIVVVRLRERLIGLLVDAASQVLKIPVAAIESAPEEAVEIDASAVRGVAKLQDRLIILIDLAKVLALELREATSLPPGGSQ